MKNTFQVLIHCTYWIGSMAVICVLFLTLANAKGIPNLAVLIPALCSVLLFPAVLSFYTMNQWVFPKFILRGKNKSAFLFSIVVVIITPVLGLLLHAVFTSFEFSFGPSTLDLVLKLIFVAFLCCFQLMLGWVLAGFLYWRKQLNEKLKIQHQNIALEQQLLNAKTNPHFLFNSINNIEILIEKAPSKASEYLLKLSGILRFLLDENDQIELKEEVNYLIKYIDLQLIRTTTASAIKTNFHVEDVRVLIAKNLLIPFVENAVKHVQNFHKQNAIEINLESNSNELLFICKNAVNDEQNNDTFGNFKIGNELIKNRLNSLYPNRHSLVIDNSKRQYSVTLKIEL